jgi:hypothetical protein
MLAGTDKTIVDEQVPEISKQDKEESFAIQEQKTAPELKHPLGFKKK